MPVLADEAIPSGGRGPDRAESLGEDREGAGRDVAIIGRGDHVLDRPDLGGRQSRRRYAGTGRLILERARALPLAPGMEPTGRHAEESQDRWQGKILARPIHGAQDPRLGASVRETRSCEAKPGGSEQGQREPEQRREFVDAAP